MGAVCGRSTVLVNIASMAWAMRQEGPVSVTSSDREPEFIVLVPGILGSTLERPDNTTVWLDFSQLRRNPFRAREWLLQLLHELEYDPAANDLHASGIVREVVVAKPWARQQKYERLLMKLRSFGYQPSIASLTRTRGPEVYAPDVYVFAYDWRQDNRVSARQLGEAIRQWQHDRGDDAAACIIAHSMGGLVARWYIDRIDGLNEQRRVSRLILMGSPWNGAPVALRMLFDGFDHLFSDIFDVFQIRDLTRPVVQSFPSMYQLVPFSNPFLRAANNHAVDLCARSGWLDTRQKREYLADGKAFHQELAPVPSIETLCFVGEGFSTVTSGTARLGGRTGISKIEWRPSDDGDGTVPSFSAANVHAKQNHFHRARHGDIYDHPGVVRQLRFELLSKTGVIP